MNAFQSRCGFLTLRVGEGSEVLVQPLRSGSSRRAESGREAYLSYSRGRCRYLSLDSTGVDFGGCWSPGSSPGMIVRER